MGMHARKKSGRSKNGGRKKRLYGDPGTAELREHETLERCTRCGSMGLIAVTIPRGAGATPKRLCHGCLNGKPLSDRRWAELDRQNVNLHRRANKRRGER